MVSLCRISQARCPGSSLPRAQALPPMRHRGCACSKRSCRLDQTAAPPGPAAAMRRTPGPLRVVEKRGLSCDVFLYFPRQDGNPRLTWQAAKRGRVPLLRPFPVQERKPVHQACPHAPARSSNVFCFFSMRGFPALDTAFRSGPAVSGAPVTDRDVTNGCQHGKVQGRGAVS